LGIERSPLPGVFLANYEKKRLKERLRKIDISRFLVSVSKVVDFPKALIFSKGGSQNPGEGNESSPI